MDTPASRQHLGVPRWDPGGGTRTRLELDNSWIKKQANGWGDPTDVLQGHILGAFGGKKDISYWRGEHSSIKPFLIYK